MTFFECIKMAFSSMRMNKMRSFLTMLGIIIGISSVITISSIGSTIKKTVSNSMFGFGMATIDLSIIERDYTSSTPVKITENDFITYEMLEGLLEEYPGDYELVASDYLDTCETINSKNEAIVLDVMGIQPGYMNYTMKKMVKGRNITARDVKETKHTAVVSEVFELQYGNDESIIGKTISLNGTYNFEVTVVGVYSDKKTLQKYNLGEKNISTTILTPYSLVGKLKGNQRTKFSYVELQPNPEVDPGILVIQAQQYFDRLYERNENWEINVFDCGEATKSLTVVIDILAIAFSLIAAISLIVGGVGVMNIMLVSVVERTSEIGIRKALGAKTKSIKRQFVTESVIICLIGGTIGIIFGLVSTYALGFIAKYMLNTLAADVAESITLEPTPSLLAIIISVICSVLIGVIFGSSPAKRAAKMNPIDALRFE